jgi:perosamine synthetase
MSSLPAFAGYPKVQEARRNNTAAYAISPRAFNLPSALLLSEEQVDRVCNLLKSLLARQPVADMPSPNQTLGSV